MDGAYPPASLVFIASMQVSLFGITETSHEARVEMSDPPIEIRVDAEPAMKTGSHFVEKGKVSPNEEVPLPLFWSTKLSSEVVLILESKEMQLGGDSTLLEAFDEHGKVGATMVTSQVVVIEGAKSPVVMEMSLELPRSLMFVNELPAIIKSTSPSIAMCLPSKGLPPIG